MRFFLALVFLVAVGAGFFYFVNPQKGPIPEIEPGEATDFFETGILHFPVVESGQAEGTFEYLTEEGTTTRKLSMDATSVCAAQGGALPCMAMSVTFNIPFDGKRATVEGINRGDAVLVRLMRVVQDGERALKKEPGRVFISWPQVVALLRSCQVTFAMQSHSLEVDLTLKGGREVTAIEPAIDELFKITNETTAACGTFPIATQ